MHPDSAISKPDPRTYVSIGIIAWNEEKSLPATLQSLFQQTLFRELASRNLRCEIFALPNGCTDNTAGVAEKIFTEQSQSHSDRAGFNCNVAQLKQRGKVHAWNSFVHELSARESRFLILMDADIVIREPQTLQNMVAALETNQEANISIDSPVKDISLKARKNFTDKVSLSATRLMQTASAQMTAQLYCIRSEIARRIFMPANLGSCEDGFLKQIICTDFLTHEVMSDRIAIAPQASHIFEAYTSPKAVLKNQKRQVIGQTILHVLIDHHLKNFALEDRLNLGKYLRWKESTDPAWLKRMVAEHVARAKHFWLLYPHLLTLRFKRLSKLRGLEKIRCLPTAVAGWFVMLIASFLASRALRNGGIDYWPHAKNIQTEKMELSPPQVGSVVLNAPR